MCQWALIISSKLLGAHAHVRVIIGDLKMACYQPKTAIETTLPEVINYETGEYVPSKKKVNFITKNGQKCLLEPWEKEEWKSRLTEHQRLLDIPCGECDGCKENYKAMWATRCYLESLEYEHNYMVTLTYNDENAPRGAKGRMSLKKKDFQDFMKRLRIEWERRHNWKRIEHEVSPNDLWDRKTKDGHYFYADNPGIRYKMCSEYGSEENTMRPHYHFIGFNLPIFDLEKFFISETDGQVYKSAELTEIWGKGYVTVIECNYNTCAYVSGYVLKKATGSEEKKNYEELGIEPEFTLGSTNPGIGARWFKKNMMKVAEDDQIIIMRKNKKNNWKYEAKQVRPPRYFDKLLEKENPDLMAEIKIKRSENAENAETLLFSKTNLSKKEYLENKERKHKEALKLLKQRKLKKVG